MTTKRKNSEVGSLPFEEAMERLEKIVTALEGDDVSLEKSLDHFEEGMTLAKVCENHLQSANARVEKIMKDFSGAEKRVPLTSEESRELFSGGDNDE